MLVSRDAIRAFGWILALTLSMVGCQGAPEQIPSKGFTDDFGGDVPTREEITVESVQDKEMLHQRAQAEFRLGTSCWRPAISWHSTARCRTRRPG